jgi:uncharacterized RDD family membrane protein YckC
MNFKKLKKQIKSQNSNKEKIKPKYIYARYSDRIKAFITDMFMIYMPIMYFITYIVFNGKEDFQESQLAPFIAVSIYAFIYSILLSKFGQTPGKKAYDLKVVDDKSGDYIGFFRSLLRYFMFLLTATTIIGALLPFYTKNKKSLHDLICNTLVVKVKEN